MEVSSAIVGSEPVQALPPGHQFVGYTEDGKVITGTGGVSHDDDSVAEEHRILMTRRSTFLIGWARKRGVERTGVTAEILEQAEGFASAEDWEQVKRLLEPVGEAYGAWMEADTCSERVIVTAQIAEYRVAIAIRARMGASTRPRGITTAASRERRDRRAARRSGQDPGDSDPEPAEPWALTWFDRAPVLWRLRAARCRLLEMREGVDR